MFVQSEPDHHQQRLLFRQLLHELMLMKHPLKILPLGKQHCHVIISQPSMPTLLFQKTICLHI
jgi:hypothetical protein